MESILPHDVIVREQSVGLKFGSTEKESRTLAYEKSYTEKNDVLGDVVIAFGDDIIINSGGKVISYTERVLDPIEGRFKYITTDHYLANLNPKYDSGKCYLYTSPLKMY